MIKKNLFIILTILLVSVLMLSGCGNGQGNSESASSNGQDSSEFSGIVPSYVANTGGAVYRTSAAIAKIFTDEGLMPNVQFSVEAAGGSPGNIRSILERYEEGRPAIGIVSTRDGAQAYQGVYEHVPGEHKELRAIGYVDTANIHLVVPASSDIKTFSDLKGKNIGAPPGAAIEDTLKELLSSLGLEEGTDYQFQPYRNAEVQQAMRDGSLDAGAITDLIPSPAINETMSLTDIRILSLSETEAENYLNEFAPYAAVRTIEAGTYDGIDEDLIIPVFTNHYITHKDTPDDLIVNYLKAMMDYPEQLKAIVPGSEISKDNILDGIEMPLHPAAEKYLREIGVLE
ncbi:TRAP transporter TAXI family solute receptor [Evansella vedderi]|uniref:TRAP transporter TAXI family solute receptor n=1 Tax=Evansella vedderi TaxID=38282 RepID=A0ABU0A0S9_9BACI|nr:TAXI family TRAP transporter solute-binding subunit [Evansella vedderi]MDQ0257077.1 TRAP transporter TAXI family solute receptor [Evansella vedderi]